MKMNLLTKEIEAKLRSNGDINREHRNIDGNTEDFKPVVKFFSNNDIWPSFSLAQQTKNIRSIIKPH